MMTAINTKKRKTMAKTLKGILEVYAPRSKDEKRFKDKHVVARSKLDQPSEDDAVFNATNIKTIDREKTRHGYNPNKDESVYESVHSMALHVKPVKVNGKTKYKVHAVGSHLEDGIKVGEHLSDTQLDDASEMGAKIKHLKEASDPADEKLGKLLDPKMKTPNLDNYRKSNAPEVDDQKVSARMAATADDVKGQRQYKERTSGGLRNKVKDVLGLDKPSDQYGPKQEGFDDEDVELLNIIYNSLTDDNKAILEDIVENNPDELLEFLDHLEVQNG